MKVKSLRLAMLLSLVLVMAAVPLSVRADTGSNWTGQYFNNNSLAGNPVLTRTDAAINFNWGAGSPDASVPADNFSVRWTNNITLPAGTYNFRAGAEDGIRVFIDGARLLDKVFVSGSFQTYNFTATLGAGSHSFEVDFVAYTGASGVLFDWTQGSSVGPTSVPGASSSTGGTTTNTYSIKAVVIGSIVNVRGGPATTFNPVAEIHKDEVYKVVASDGTGSWFELVLADGNLGWVFRRLIFLYGGDPGLLPITKSAVTPPALAVDVEGIANVAIIVRDGPSKLNSKKIGALNQGDSFKILALSRTRAWVQINANGLIGWVFLPNITVVSGELGRVPVSPLPK